MDYCVHRLFVHNVANIQVCISIKVENQGYCDLLWFLVYCDVHACWHAEIHLIKLTTLQVCDNASRNNFMILERTLIYELKRIPSFSHYGQILIVLQLKNKSIN